MGGEQLPAPTAQSCAEDACVDDQSHGPIAAAKASSSSSGKPSINSVSIDCSTGAVISSSAVRSRGNKLVPCGMPRPLLTASLIAPWYLRTDVAAQRIGEANSRCAPFDAKFTAATDAVNRAETAQHAAEARLDQSGFRGRRQPRSELAAADEIVAGTNALLATARQQSREPNARRAAAREQIESARAALSNHDIHTRWQYLPEHLAAAEAHVDALDTWRDWATGKPVTQDHLVEAVATLHDIADHQPDNGTRQLANVIDEWADRRGILLSSPPVENLRSERTGIEIDL